MSDMNETSEPLNAPITTTDAEKLNDVRVVLLDPTYASIGEIARVTKLRDSHILAAVTSGDLLALNVGTVEAPVYRISKADVGAWIARKGTCLSQRRQHE